MINEPERLIYEERLQELSMYGVAKLKKNYKWENYLTCYKTE